MVLLQERDALEKALFRFQAARRSLFLLPGILDRLHYLLWSIECGKNDAIPVLGLDLATLVFAFLDDKED